MVRRSKSNGVKSKDEEEEERREMTTPALRGPPTKQGYKLMGCILHRELCSRTKHTLHTFNGIESVPCMEAKPGPRQQVCLLLEFPQCVLRLNYASPTLLLSLCTPDHLRRSEKEGFFRVPVNDTRCYRRGFPGGGEVTVGRLFSASVRSRCPLRRCDPRVLELVKPRPPSGKGVPGAQPERYEEGLAAEHCALSLVVEPIMYSEINSFLCHLQLPCHQRTVP
ncbi:unnamed protein product [Arctogadus glacialis]